MHTSPDWYRRVVDAAADGIWVVDLDGATIDANPATTELLGRTLEQLREIPLTDLLDDEGRVQFAEHLVDVRRDGTTSEDVECLFHRPDGSRVWTLVREAFVHDDAGQPVGLVLTITDHRERKRLIDDLQGSERQRREAERIARLGGWWWTAATDVFEVSDGMRALYGDRVTSLFTGIDAFQAAIHPDDRQRVHDAVHEAVEAGVAFEYEARVHAESGYIWIRGRGEVHRDADGVLQGLSGTQQDVTRARDTDDALQDLVTQNSFMQTVATAANEAATLGDVLTHARELVLLHDDWDRARAFTPTDDGRSLVPYVLDESGPDTTDVARRESETAQRALEAGHAVWDDDVRLTVATPVRVGDEIVAVIAVSSLPPLYRHDMIASMLEQAAEQLAQVAVRERAAIELAEARDRALEASRHKSDFLATMSHEIRTPLNGIIGLSELLGRTVLDERQRHLVAGVDLSGRALLDVINDILDFSKIEAGRLELEDVDLDVREVVDQVASMLADGARAKGLDLRVQCGPDVPRLVAGDPARLAQVLTNLGSNAVKFTAQGRVAIVVTIEGEADDGAGDARLRVEVRDTGVGVHPDLAERIFEPFAQADTSTTRHFGGTGLGLAICREIVEAMHGEIGVAAGARGGSTFWFEVPLRPARGVAPDAPGDLARAQLAGLRVLVVDDDATNRLVLTEQLAWWGVATHAVSSAQTALAALDARDYDVAILDMAMPEVDGLTLAAAIRARTSPPGVPPVRLLMFTSSYPFDAATLTEHGIAECLAKPVSSGAVRDVLLRARGLETAPHAPVASPRRPDRILVVEDNPVNQLVATGLLDALGYRADTADDGLQALEMVARGRYDLVLMDLQMPGLDGHATTRELRDRERAGGLPRTPIVAMTAAAVEEEHERALASGMDGFLTKPVTFARLAEAVAFALDPDATVQPAAPLEARPAEADGSGVVDRARLEELGELSADYLRRVVDGFATRGPTLVGAVRAAGDPEGLADAAHALKGASSNLGLTTLWRLAEELERLARGGQVAPSALLAELDDALAAAVPALRAHAEAVLADLPDVADLGEA